MNSKELENLGFSKNEAVIYLALLKKGPMQAGIISKKTQINRRTTYDTIERLIEKGYVSFSIAANKKVFKAAEPKIVLEKVNEMKKQAESILPSLQTLYKENKEDQETNTFKGRKGIRNILHQLLEVKEYVGFGSNEMFPEIMKGDFAYFQKRKKELKIKSRTLMSKSMKNKNILKTAHTKYRFLDDAPSQPTSTFVYENKVAIIVWSTIPIGLVIENSTLAKTYLDYFNALWNNAKD